MSSAGKSFLILAFIFQFLANVLACENCSKSKKQRETLKVAAWVKENKLLANNTSQLLGDFLDIDNVQKMRRSSKQWRNVKIYEKISPNYHELAVFRHVNTNETMWKSIKFKQPWYWTFADLAPRPRILATHLLRNDPAKWNDVFLWFVENVPFWGDKSQNVSFLKELMLAIAENINVTFRHPRQGNTPLVMAAAFDDTKSILALIKRGANVNQQTSMLNHRPNQWSALHIAVYLGNINACAALLENNANIEAVADPGRMTPLMVAAVYGSKQMIEFLIEKGAVPLSPRVASQMAYNRNGKFYSITV